MKDELRSGKTVWCVHGDPFNGSGRASRFGGSQRERRVGGEGSIGGVAGLKMEIARGGDHGGVVGRECERRKENFQAARFRFLLKKLAEQGITRHATAHKDRLDVVVVGGGKGALDEVRDYSVLKARDKIERRGGTLRTDFFRGHASGVLSPRAAVLGFGVER